MPPKVLDAGIEVPDDEVMHQALIQAPVLSPSEELTLARQIVQYRRQVRMWDDALRDADTPESRAYYQARLSDTEYDLHQAQIRMFEANIRLVMTMARRCHRMEYWDMFQNGCMALWRAIELFDPDIQGDDQPIRISTYATTWIRQGIWRAADKEADTIRLPVSVLSKIRKVKRVQTQLFHERGEDVSLQEACEIAGENPSKISEAILINDPVSMEMKLKSPSLSRWSLLDASRVEEVLATETDSPEQQVVDTVMRAEIVAQITDALDWLAEIYDPDRNEYPYTRHVQALRLRFRIGEHPNTSCPLRTLDEVGVLMYPRIGKERVRQLVAVGIKVIKPRLSLLGESIYASS